MPYCSRASTAAHTKWKQSNNWFTQTSPEFSDTGSLYNDPGDENSGDESSVLNDFDDIGSNDDDTAESLESLQKLYKLFLYPNKQKEVQKRMVSMIYTGDSYQWLVEKEKPKQSCRRVPEHDSIFSGKWEDHF